MNRAKNVEMILAVPSVEDAVAWYELVLGWEGGFDVFDADGKCNFGGVNGSGEDSLHEGRFVGYDMIRWQGDPASYTNNGAHFNFLIYVENVNALYKRVLESGWPVESPLADQFWGARTFSLRDLSGFSLVFATKIEALQPEEVRQRYEAIRS